MIVRGVELFCTLYIGNGDILENCREGSYSKNRRKIRRGGVSDEGCKDDFESGASSIDSSIVGSGSACKYAINCGKLCTGTADVLYSFLWNLYGSKAALESDFAFGTYGMLLCAGLLRRRMVYYHAGRCKRETDGLHQGVKENRMDRTIMEDYYDQKYGENMEKNPWEKLPEYQELLGKQTRIEDAIRGLLGDEYHRVWQLYEDAMSVQFAMEEVGIKYMYLQGAEDREQMLR